MLLAHGGTRTAMAARRARDGIGHNSGDDADMGMERDAAKGRRARWLWITARTVQAEFFNSLVDSN